MFYMMVVGAFALAIWVASALVAAVARGMGGNGNAWGWATALTITLLTVSALYAAGIFGETKLPEPAINANPVDRVSIRYSSTDVDVSPANATLVAGYASFKKACCRVDHLESVKRTV